MKFKYEISKVDFEKLDEVKQSLYKSSGDGYQLNVEGVVSKSKLDEFRDSNIELTNKLKIFDKVDITKWDGMVKHEQLIADKKLIDAGDIDKLIAQKVDVITSDFQSKMDVANKKIEDLTISNTSVISRYEIQGATSKAFSAHKIRPEAQDAITSQINSKFSIKNGSAVAMDGDKIEAGSNGNLTISEFVGSQPDFMKIPSSGGDGSGGGGGGHSTEKTSLEKIQSGLVKLAK